MAATEYSVIRRWVKYWEDELLKRPKELVLGSEYVINVVPEALNSLEEWHAKNPGKKLQKNSKMWAVKLLELLERAVQEDPVVDLLALESNDEMKELGELLNTHAYEVNRIISILRTIREAPSSRVLQEAVVKELIKGKKANHQVLQAVAVVLARRGIGKFTDRELRKVLEQTLAGEGTLALIEKQASAMNANKGLEERACWCGSYS